MDEYSVWIAENIEEEMVTPTEEEGGEPYTQYTYTLIQYDKDEYIEKMAELNDTLKQQSDMLTECILEMSEVVYQ